MHADREATTRIFCSFPHNYPALVPTAKEDVQARVEEKFRAFFESKGAKIRMAPSVKTKTGLTMPKALIFVEHPPGYYDSAAFMVAANVTEIKYFDVGHVHPAKTVLPRPLLSAMQAKGCCLLPSCIPLLNTGRGARACGRLDRFFQERRDAAGHVGAPAVASERKRARDAQMAALAASSAQVAFNKVAVDRFACRAWVLGR